MVKINTIPVTEIDPVKIMICWAWPLGLPLEEFRCYGLNCYYLPEFHEINAKRHVAGRSNAANL